MRKPVPSLTALLFAVVALSLLAVPALAADRYELVLEGRRYVPAEVKLAREDDSHLVVQFYEIPTDAEREALAEAGITLLDYMPNYAWTARVRGGAVQALEPGLVRAVFELRPEDKILRSATGQDVVRAFVHDGVEGAEEVLTRYGSIIDVDHTGYTLVLDGDVLELAGEDIVKCIMGPRPELALHLDELRDNINADEVQTSPYDLHGNGLAAGIWDGGRVASNHDDFNGRLIFGDGSSTHYHATKCAGIMAGDGSRSSAEGGSPYQWRGVATEVDIISYDWPYDLADMDDETSAAIASYDIIVSTNSWGWGLCPDYCYYYGTYDDYSWNYDRIVRGSAGKKLTVVFSAGNDGDCNQCSGDIPEYPYGTIPGPGSTSKNAIVVGSSNADTDGLSYYSSMGPTLDGRLKPDVAAPGCKSYEGINTTYLYNDYDDGGCGTSYSAPAVSGSVILAQEDYIDKFGSEAWPSTMKALIIQGAEDKGNPGPDYQFGHGRINTQNTIDIIRADGGTGDLIKQDTLSPAETWEYDIEVTAGEDLKVTLAWDDYQGDWGAGGTMLVNDLDLELEAPGGGIYYPWLLDPSNPSNNATTGADHLNNVEQVEVSSPATGTWTIRVTATVIPEPNQDFSVVTNFAGGAVDPPPAAPTGLDAVPGSGEGEIDVSWDANSEPDLDHYRLERDDNPSFSSPASFVVYGTSYGDSGLTPGGTYHYRVFAVDAAANESGASSTDSAVATDLAPAAPTGLNAVTGSGEGEIDISWSPNSEPDFDHYRLERASNPSFSGATSFTVSSTSYTDSGLTPGDRYYYRAYAVDEGGNESGDSGSDSAFAADLPPAAPTGLVAVTGALEGEIDVTWSASPEPDFDHYRLERNTDPGFGPGTDPFDLPEPVFHDSGLTPGQTYYYRVIAVDTGGNESGPSNVDSAAAQDLPPSPPTGLVAVTGSAEGEIDISWSANPEPDIDRYRLERSLAPDFEPGSEPFEEPAVSFTDTGLIPGELYYYRVYAIDANDNVSAPSNVDSAIALDLDPTVPTGLTVLSGTGEGEIDAAWDSNSEADLSHYDLEWDADAGFPAPTQTSTASTSHTAAGLTPGDTYWFRVRAVDDNSNTSDWSAPESAVATDLPPAAPTGLLAVTGAAEGEIEISWDPSSDPDFDRYRLERSTAPDFEPGSEPFEGAVAYFTDSGLVPGETYYYRVYAIDTGENVSDPSNVDSAAALDLPPSVPTGLALAPGTNEGEIDADWDLNSEPDIDHYDLEWDTDGGFTAPTQIPVVSPPHTTGGLVPTETYWFRVRSVDNGGAWSSWSAPQSMTPTNTPPTMPLGLWSAPGAGEGEIDLGWDANPEPDMDHYRLERDVSAGFAAPVSFVVYGTTYDDSGLTPGDTYHYRVFAVDTGGNESAPSAPDSAAATDLAPAAPTGLTAMEGAGDGDVELEWDANPEPDIDHYRLERDTTAVFGAGTVSVDVPGTSHTDPGLAPGTYYYRVSAVDVGGHESTPGDTVSITLEQTGVGDDVLAAGISLVRPNPFTTQTAIHFAVPSGGADVSIVLYDIRGRHVATLVDRRMAGGVHEAAWDGRDSRGAVVASGVYFARASIGEWGGTTKIVYVR
jgi:fibronectin type 3 domain-containing protein